MQPAVSWNARCKLKVYFQSSLVIEQDFLGVYYFNKCIYTVKKELSLSELQREFKNENTAVMCL